MAESAERGYQSPTRTELVWPGKRTRVERIALPFQVVETVNQSRATREREPLLAGLPPPPLFEGHTTADTSWKNKLIWGDNKYVMASLFHGDPSIGLEPLAGRIDLIYIDPPFDTGDNFSISLRVGDEDLLKRPSIIEETAYRDTWGTWPELDSYLQVLYDRLVLMRDLLSDRGSMYVHMDWHVGHYVKLLLDEVFGKDKFITQVIWQKFTPHGEKGKQETAKVHDVILLYSKSANTVYNPIYRSYRGYYAKRARTDPDGRLWVDQNLGKLSEARVDQLRREGRIFVTKAGKMRRKQFLDEMPGEIVGDVWTDIERINSQALERTGFATQKPEALLDRIIKASSNHGDLVADFFCGSGTMMAAAEKLGRRWIGCDLSRFAVQVSRKRLLDIPDCRPFRVLNLARYERKHWQVSVLTSPQDDTSEAVAEYLRFIVTLYQAEPAEGYAHLHGQKAGRWVHVGATDASVTRDEIMSAVRECQLNHYSSLDVLGWEWEMGLHDTIRDEARRLGVDLRLLNIPREVMDKRAVAAGDVRFYELAYLKPSLLQDSRTVTVKLDDFIIPNPDLVPDEVRTKVKKWSDYIDFWAVDWNYAEDTFHNEWQTYRTRKSPVLRLISDPHTYQEPGRYRILVKVIDIFGNDTTQLLELTAP